ncbi:MAG: hypothetical protein HYR93_08345 [Chloroflexi bacterium]|nr:hypothetical protein [Chloroflexota bacterium]MBI2758245.1 hypothetical protein [Chloroflexota bacterium]
MRKAALIIVFGLFMQACSVPDITALIIPATPTSPPPAASPTETVYVTPSQTPSVTPTLPTPTFTTTPTLVFSGSTATPSFMPLPTSTLWILTQNNLLTPQSYGFDEILVSGPLLYWGSCQPNTIKMIARVSNVILTRDVLIFLRLRDKTSDETTEWGGGAIMDGDGKGNFTYILTAQNITHYREYKSAWVQYQFIAADRKLNVIGRTAPYLNSLSIAPCP